MIGQNKVNEAVVPLPDVSIPFRVTIPSHEPTRSCAAGCVEALSILCTTKQPPDTSLA